MLTQFPELWACGVAGVPFFDHIDAQLDPAVRDDLRWWDHENVGDLESDRARLVYYSPDQPPRPHQAPVLLLAAERDPRCPPRQIADGGRGAHAPRCAVRAIVYPDEGHEISGLEHRLDYDRRTVEFILDISAWRRRLPADRAGAG